ncbi:hypothetical protein M3P05_20310 [Sansalvadorimonas sp. 2012CJ34-2]|uniref:Transposase IS4-like domain-containing protein n=1 Tax=Parendozoicomonas callyspongiae TaxID=2942213 RepID=A0ABT0PLY9_9GAMM|nr:hypothetical protein [Sansalvadorimonas sp. 2012CJ34-2]MCL6272266.1 hypothetical protein [Sansalvadorimonas sp. 2012CJ34-2]
MPASKKKAIADDLIPLVSKQVSKIEDFRPNKMDTKIPLHDAVMSAFAMMHLKYPSLLQFDKDKLEPETQANLKSLYHVNKTPSDTHMRVMLDPVPTRELAPCFKALFTYVQRSGRLQQFRYFEEGYLVPCDGTGYFSSGKNHCSECCVKNPGTPKEQYYHQLLGICIVKPGIKAVLPLMPEPIIQQVDASKNDCEVNALKRALKHIHQDHPQLKLIFNLDDLYSKGPTIKMIRSYQHNVIAVAKDSDHTSLFEAVDEYDKHNRVLRFEQTDDKGHRHWFRYTNGVALNKTHSDLKLNFLEYVEYDGQGKTCYANSWVTSLPLSHQNCMKVMRGGRAKWKIENETFNTLKTQGYNLEHNYGHGEEHLSSNMACLMFLAFLVDQIEQLACPVFNRAWQSCFSKIKLWEVVQQYFMGFQIDSWYQLLKTLAYRRTRGTPREIIHISSLVPDTS